MFREGTNVEARFRGGKFYPGVVTRRNRDGTFDIHFDDGDKESHIPEKNIRFQTRSSATSGGGSDGEVSPSKGGRGKRNNYNDDMSHTLQTGGIFVGQEIEAKLRGRGAYHRGTIMRDNGDGTFRVQYDSGEVESRVREAFIQVPVDSFQNSTKSPSRSRKQKGIRLGESVEAKFRGGKKYYPGKITSVNRDGTYDIDFNDGDRERNVTEDCIRLKNAFEDDNMTISAVARDHNKVNPQVKRLLNRIGSELGSVEAVEDQFALFERLDMSAKGTVMLRDFERLVRKMGVRLSSGEVQEISEAFDQSRNGEVSYRNFLNQVSETIQGGSRGAARSGSAHRSNSASKNFTRGERVKAQFKGGRKMYPGKILRVNPDGTCDIKYDDGDFEQRIDPSKVESLEQSSRRDEFSDKEDDPLDSTIRAGDKVEARYRGGKRMYPGNIIRVNRDGTYDIQYDDGDSERRVPANYVKSTTSPRGDRDRLSGNTEFRRGERVKAKFKGGSRMYPGKITAMNRDGTYNIAYDDGDSERNVPSDSIKSLENESKPQRIGLLDDSSDDTIKFVRGDRVEARFRRGKRYFPGKISRVHTDGTCDVSYDDGDVDRNLSPSMIRKRGGTSGSLRQGSFSKGERVEAKFRKGTRYYPGRITAVHMNGSCDIDYDDGDFERNVKPDIIRSLESKKVKYNAKHDHSDVESVPQDPCEGDTVRARFRGGRKMYPGKITRVNRDGTFSIHYDDGDTERSVPRDFIEFEPKSPRTLKDSLNDLRQGDRVEGRFRGGHKYYPGKLLKVRPNGSFDILYDDGDTERAVSPSMVRSVASTGSPKRSPGSRNKLGGRKGTMYTLDSDSEVDSRTSYRTGEKVEARFRGGRKYYKGKITAVSRDGTYSIAYEDGDRESGVESNMIRKLAGSDGRRGTVDSEMDTTYEKGEVVEARFRRGTRYYRGKVIRCNRDGTYDIHYDDGDREQGVETNLMKKLKTSRLVSDVSEDEGSRIEVGDRVEARYRGGTRYYPGEVSRVHSNGSVDIQYDDGDNETRVRSTWVKKISSSSRKNKRRDTFDSMNSDTGSVSNTSDKVIRILQKSIQGAIDQKRIDSFYDAFEMFDRNGDGKVSRREFDQALRKLRIRFGPADMRAILQEFDVDGDGVISYREFVRTMKSSTKKHNSFESTDDEFSTTRPRSRSPRKQIRSPRHQRLLSRDDDFTDNNSLSEYSNRGRSPSRRRHLDDNEEAEVDDTVVEFRKTVRKLERNGKSLSYVFDTLDRNGNGFIDRVELSRGIRKLGIEPLSKSQVQELIDRFDTNNDSKLNMKEFKTFIRTGSMRATSRSRSRSGRRGRKGSLDQFEQSDSFSDGSGGATRSRSRKRGTQRHRKSSRDRSSDSSISSSSIEPSQRRRKGRREDSDNVLSEDEDDLYESDQKSQKRYTELSSDTKKKLVNRVKGKILRRLTDRFRKLDGKKVGTIKTRAFKDILLHEDDIELSRREVSALERYFGEDGRVEYQHFLRYCRTGETEESERLQKLNRMRELQQVDGEDDPIIQETLIKFRSLVRKAVTTGVANDYNQVFEMIDQNGSGKISREEFDKSLKRLGFELTKDEVKKLVKRFAAKDDATGSSSGELTINYKDFVKVCSGGMDQERWIIGNDGKVCGNTYEGEVESQVRQKLRKWGAKSKEGKATALSEFKRIDKRGTGYVTRRDVRKVANNLEWKLSREEIGTILNRFDEKANGKFAYKSFLSFVSLGDNAVYGQQENLRELVSSLAAQGVDQLECFQLFDSDHDGKISAAELSASMSKLGFPSSLAQAKELIRKVDVNRDGKISYAEFVRAFGDVTKSVTSTISSNAKESGQQTVLRANDAVQLARAENAATTGMFYDWTMGLGTELVNAGGVPLAPSGSVGEWLEKDASPIERKNFFEFLNLVGTFERRLGLQQRRQANDGKDGEVVLQLGSKLRVAMRFLI